MGCVTGNKRLDVGLDPIYDADSGILRRNFSIVGYEYYWNALEASSAAFNGGGLRTPIASSWR